MPKLLLVEDDIELAELTSEYLIASGFEVEIETNGLRAIDRIKTLQPDLAILDVMLPGCDGLEVCRRVRDSYPNPILMLTAKTDYIDQILGLEIGADDYISKPVEPRLLLARVKALLRRGQKTFDIPQNPGKMIFGNLTINNRTRTVSLGEKELLLATPAFDLLSLLATNAGTILSRDDIRKKIWGLEYDGVNRSVDICISQIRAEINSENGASVEIKTIRGKGYLFVAESDR